jgi:hypothetical protein
MEVMKDSDWKIYRTRFLVRARQLDAPLRFVDALGREHQGKKGDYLVQSSDGCQRIAPREIFEDVYVAMAGVEGECPLICRREWPVLVTQGPPSQGDLAS